MGVLTEETHSIRLPAVRGLDNSATDIVETRAIGTRRASEQGVAEGIGVKPSVDDLHQFNSQFSTPDVLSSQEDPRPGPLTHPDTKARCTGDDDTPL